MVQPGRGQAADRDLALAQRPHRLHAVTGRCRSDRLKQRVEHLPHLGRTAPARERVQPVHPGDHNGDVGDGLRREIRPVAHPLGQPGGIQRVEQLVCFPAGRRDLPVAVADDRRHRVVAAPHLGELVFASHPDRRGRAAGDEGLHRRGHPAQRAHEQPSAGQRHEGQYTGRRSRRHERCAVQPAHRRERLGHILLGEDAPAQTGNFHRPVGEHRVDAARVGRLRHPGLVAERKLDRVVAKAQVHDRRAHGPELVGDCRRGAVDGDLRQEPVGVDRHEAGLAAHQPVLADQLHLARFALAGELPAFVVGEQAVERPDVDLRHQHANRLPAGDDRHGGEHLRREG